MSTQRENAIERPTKSAPTTEQRDGSPQRASTSAAQHPMADHDTLVVMPVPQSVTTPQASGHATPPAQRGSVHVASNLRTLVIAAPLGDTQQVAAVYERRDLNELVRGVLIVGLVISSALMLVGIGLDLVYQREFPVAVPTIGDVLSRVAALRPSGFLALGLLALIATPIIRVVGSIGAFLYERDWRYAAITSLVLAVLIASLALGRG